MIDVRVWDYVTRYADANAKWFAWMSKNFRNKGPLSGDFFYVVYDQAKERFLPVGDVGADCWALGWGYPWFPSSELAREGWKHILDRAKWRRPSPDMVYAQNSLLMGCCSGGWPPVSNAFVPLVAVQGEGRGSPAAVKVLRWLEAKYGRQVDMDGDGHRESYYYHTDDALRIATTGNIAAALATDGDSLRRLFRTPRHSILTAPTVAHVDYPNVYVRTAEYVAPVLRFVVLKGTPGFHGQTEIRCTQCPGHPTVLRDGQPFQDFEQTGSTLVIRTDVEREHVFQVTPGDAPPRTAGPEARKTGGITAHSEDGRRYATPRINGPYVRVYIPGEDIFPGPDSEHFQASRSYKEWVPNDFAILKGPDDRWHAIGITHPKPPGFDPPAYNPRTVHEAEWLLFHAVSPRGNLKEHLKEGAWRDAKKVLPPGHRPGEIRECHAPFVVRKDGLYHMVYGPNPLRLAASTNLYDWKPAGVLFQQEGGARDPNVVLHGGRYILAYVTRNSILARTSQDLRHWSTQPVEVFRMRRSGDPESPSIVECNGQFYLFWCLWDASDAVSGAYDYRTFVYRSSNPLDFKDAPCVAELKAHAPKVFQDESGDWFISSVEWPSRGVSIAPLAWK